MRRRSDHDIATLEAITDPWQCMTNLVVKNIRRSPEFTVESVNVSGHARVRNKTFGLFLILASLFS
jgi:hypothetical protein